MASGGGTLADPFLILREDDGVFLVQDDNDGPGNDASITISVDTPGTYYLNVRTFAAQGGTYRITTSPVERLESDPLPVTIIPGITVAEGNSDARGDTLATDVLISGDTFAGSLDSSSDQDWISIDLTAGFHIHLIYKEPGTGRVHLPMGFLCCAIPTVTLSLKMKTVALARMRGWYSRR